MKWLAASMTTLFVLLLMVSGFATADPQLLCEIDRANNTTETLPELAPLTDHQWETATTIVTYATEHWNDRHTPFLQAIAVTAALYASNLSTTPGPGVPVKLNPFTGQPTTEPLEVSLESFYLEVLSDQDWHKRPPTDVVRWALAEPGARLHGVFEQGALIVGAIHDYDATGLIAAAAADPGCLYAKQAIGEIVTVDGITWPVPGHMNIRSRFGMRLHPIYKTNRLHAGVDIGAPCGTAIVPAMPGLVVTVDRNRAGFGTLVEVLHSDGFMTRYAHMYPGAIYVSEGDHVDETTRIADVGSAGTSTACHLHIELRNAKGQVIDAGAAFGWY